MAYDPKNLSALAYANGFTLWHYKTPDLPAEVDTSGYFDSAATMLRTGDFIMANTNTGGTVQSGMFIVKSNTGTVVDTANFADLGALNGD
jgi:outer membrane protein assembly factor BamB